MKLKRRPKIKPTAGKVIINPEPLEEVRPSGLIILQKANTDAYQKGVVVALGRPLPGLPIQMKYMDNVLFPKGCGIKYESEGFEYLLMNQDEVTAVL